MKSPQLSLPFAKRKRRRRRAKRPGPVPAPHRVGFVPHVAREPHHARHPVHVTMRRVRGAPSLRAEVVYKAIVSQLRVVAKRGVRVVHYSVQHDHLHLMVEASDTVRLARSMQLLFSRIAFAVNRLAQRYGKLFRDRHHRHELATPTEVRRALVYIFFNERKHDAEKDGFLPMLHLVDGHSSVMWFEDWAPLARPPPDQMRRRREEIGDAPITAPSTWLAREGWRRARGGLLRFDEMPRWTKNQLAELRDAMLRSHG
jgi:putative transposase